MAVKRRRRNVEGGEFEDPLPNYDAPIYEDELERSLAEDSLANLETTPVEIVSSDWTIEKVVALMGKHKIASVLIVDDRQLKGIFSERDILHQVADQYDEIKAQPITSVMTKDPVVAYITDSPAKAINIMATGGFRHIPVLDVDDKVVGVLGPRRISRYLQEHFS